MEPSYTKESDMTVKGDKAIFEVIDEDKHYRIYENGKVEGFGEGAIILNRIPVVFAQRMAKEVKE